MREWWKHYLTDANGDADGVALLAIGAFLALTAIAIYECFFVVPHQPFNYLGYGTAMGVIFSGLGVKHKLEVQQ